MHTNRRAILQLVAMGRVTPAEAERLLIACSDSRETAWILAACIAIAGLAQLNLPALAPGLLHIAHLLTHGTLISLRPPLSLVTHLSGGIL